MSSEKKFRIQNGLDVAGEVLVNGINIVGADGVLNQASYQTAVQAMIDATVALGVDQNSIDSAVSTAVAALADSAPETLDTLNELAAALGDDADFATSMTNALNTKLSAANNLSDVADAAAARSNLGLGSAATAATTSFATAAQGTKADNAATQADLTALESQITNGVATTSQGALADTAVQPEDFSTGISTVNTNTPDWSDNTWNPSFTSLSNSNYGNNPPRVKTSPNGNVIAHFSIASTAHKVIVWDSAGNELYDETFNTSNGQGHQYSRADVDINDTHFMIAATGLGVRVIDISTGALTFSSEGPSSTAGIDAGLQFVYGYLEGNYVVFTFGRSDNGLYADGIKVYDWTNGSLVSTYSNPNTIYFVVESGYAYLTDGNSIKRVTLSDGSDTTLIGTNGLAYTQEGRNLAVSSNYLITGGGNISVSGGVRIRDINTGNLLYTITPPSGADQSSSFGGSINSQRGNISVNGNTLAISYKVSSGSGNAVYIFDISLLGASTSADNYQQIISGSDLVADNTQSVLNHTITDDQKFILAYGTEAASSQYGVPNISITPGPVLTVTTFEVDDSLFATRAYADSAVAGVDLTNYSNTIAMNTAIATAKSEAVTLAATDATTKADAAQAAAEAFATTAAANAAAGVVDSAPEALDTLNELAAALGDDASFATTVTNSLATKASSADLSTTQSEVTALQGMVGTQTYEAYGSVTGGSAVALTSTGKVTQISSNIPDMNETYTTLGTNIDKRAMFMDWDTVNNQLIVMATEKSSTYGAEKIKISAVTPDPMSLETTVNYSYSSPSSSNSNNYVYMMGEASSKKAIMAVIPGTAYYVLVNAERERIALFHNNGSSISQVSISTFNRAQISYFNHAVVDGELHLFYKQNGVGWGEENNNNVMGTKISVYDGNLVIGTEYNLYSAASNQSDFENYFFSTYQSNKIMPDRVAVETIDGQDWMFMLHGLSTNHAKKIIAMKVDVSNEQLSFGDAKEYNYSSKTSNNYHIDTSIGDTGGITGGWISYSAYSGNVVVPMKSGNSNTYIRALVLEFDSSGDLVEKAFISPLISDQGNQSYNSIAVATSSLSDTVTFMYGRSYYGDNGWGYVLGSIDSSGSWTEIEKWRGGAHTYSDSTNGSSTAFVAFDGPELNGHSVFLRNNTSGSNSGTGIQVKAHVSRMTPVSNTAQWIGIATATQTDGENVQVAIKNSSTTVLTGLSVGSTYYVQDDGSVTTTESDYIAGLALTSGKLLLEGADLSPYATSAELAATLSQAQAYADSASSVAATGVDFSNEIAAARSGAVADVAASDLDMGGNKVLFGNLYSTVADLPDASTYHGMFAHVHATGKGYFAHAGNWVELANTSDLLTQSDIDTAIANLVDTAPEALNTLNELAAALGDDANFASTMTTSLAAKADDATVTAALATKATTAQGALADTAIQPEDFGTGITLGAGVSDWSSAQLSSQINLQGHYNTGFESEAIATSESYFVTATKKANGLGNIELLVWNKSDTSPASNAYYKDLSSSLPNNAGDVKTLRMTDEYVFVSFSVQYGNDGNNLYAIKISDGTVYRDFKSIVTSAGQTWIGSNPSGTGFDFDIDDQYIAIVDRSESNTVTIVDWTSGQWVRNYTFAAASDFLSVAVDSGKLLVSGSRAPNNKSHVNTAELVDISTGAVLHTFTAQHALLQDANPNANGSRWGDIVLMSSQYVAIGSTLNQYGFSSRIDIFNATTYAFIGTIEQDDGVQNNWANDGMGERGGSALFGQYLVATKPVPTDTLYVYDLSSATFSTAIKEIVLPDGQGGRVAISSSGVVINQSIESHTSGHDMYVYTVPVSTVSPFIVDDSLFATRAFAESAVAGVDLTNYSNTTAMNTAIATAKSEAISAASTDATTKADAAEAAAISAANTAVANAIDAAPDSLNTLNELAAALGDDANFASTVTASLATKADVSALADKADASAVATTAQGALADTSIQPEDLTTGFGTNTVTVPDFGGSYTTNVAIPSWGDTGNGGFSGYGFGTIRSNSTYYLVQGSYTSYNPTTNNKVLKLLQHSDDSIVWSKTIAQTRQIAMNETHAAIAESDGVKIYDMAGNLVNTITTAGGHAIATNQGMEFFGDNGLLLGDGYPNSNWQTTGRVFAVNYLTGQDLGTINLPVTQYMPNNGISETTMFAVSPDQSKVYIGDWRGSPTSERYGRVYIADLSTFTVTDTIDNPNPGDDEDFGISVAVNSEYLVVGRNNKNSSGFNNNTGALEVFTVSDLNHVGTLEFNQNSNQNVNYGLSGAFPHKLAVAPDSNYVFASIYGGNNHEDDIRVTNLDNLSESFFLETNQNRNLAGPSVVIRGSDVIAFGNGRVCRFTANEGTTTVSYVVDDSLFATKAYVDSGVAGVDLSGYTTTADLTSSDLDLNGNKVLFGNVYSNLADLPSATTYHGMFAHVHATGKGYFAHAGNWVELANTSDLLTQSDIDTAVANLVDTAPDSLNTLNELAAALGDDANFASTMTNSLASKADSATVTAALADKADVTYVNSEIAGLSTTIANINVTGDINSALGSYSTTAQMNTAISTAVDGVLDTAPEALNTLNELAAALGDDANFASTMTTSLAGKATTAQGALADTAIQPADLTTGFSTTTTDTVDLTNEISVVDHATHNSSVGTNTVIGNGSGEMLHIGTYEFTLYLSNNDRKYNFGTQHIDMVGNNMFTDVSFAIDSTDVWFANNQSGTLHVYKVNHETAAVTKYNVGNVMGDSNVMGAALYNGDYYVAVRADDQGAWHGKVLRISSTGSVVNTYYPSSGTANFVPSNRWGMIGVENGVLTAPSGQPMRDIFAFDVETGNQLWSINESQFGINLNIFDNPISVMHHSDKYLLVTSEGDPSNSMNNTVTVIDRLTGSVVSTISNPFTEKGQFGNSMVIIDDQVFIGGIRTNNSSGRNAVFDATDGSQLYELSDTRLWYRAARKNSNTINAIKYVSGSNFQEIEATFAISTDTTFSVDDTVFATKTFAESAVAGVDFSAYSTTVQMNTAITTAADAAEADAIATASSDATTKANAAEAAAIATASSDASTKANAAQSAAAADATSKADAAQAAAISTASSDATTKADAAQAAAIAAAATDATTKANAAQTAAETFATNAATTAVANVIDTAPDSLNTLNELAAALGDDANFASTVTAALADKADSTTVSTVSTVANSALQPADAAGLSVDDADKLDGEHGTHYRINIYDINGTLVN